MTSDIEGSPPVRPPANALRHDLMLLLLAAAIATGAALLSTTLENVLFWMAAAVAIIASVLAVGVCGRLSLRPFGRNISLLPFQRVAFSIFGLLLAAVLSEMFLEWREHGGAKVVQVALKSVNDSAASRLKVADRHAIPLGAEARAEILKRAGVLTMPVDWERKSVSIAGSNFSYLWHGYLHVHDRHYFRRNRPFPPPQPGVMRLMLVGDSMTYGHGVDERFTYASLLQQQLGQNYRIEVLNLGRSGWQSEDILQVVRDFLPQLRPDLVFYGHVHNDFLPSQKGQYVARGFEAPIPERLQVFLTRRSRFVRFVGDSYDASLRAIGVRKDFFDDILDDFAGYQQRFARDVKAINDFVTSHRLPPVISMVLDQAPDLKGRGYQITSFAERYLAEAGMQVIPTAEYYRRYDGYRFKVSFWDGHADEEAHAIFASMILPVLERHPALQSFRKTANPTLSAAGW